MKNGHGVMKIVLGCALTALLVGAGAFVTVGANSPSRSEMQAADDHTKVELKEWVLEHEGRQLQLIQQISDSLAELKTEQKGIHKAQEDIKLEQRGFQTEMRTKLDIIEKLTKERR